jgi:ABC-type glycerol-3-phosphate transport system substrate-binding protein
MVYVMGNNFQWQTDTEIDPPPVSSKLHRSWEMIGFWLITAVISTFLVGGWVLSQRRLAQFNDEIRAELQALLDLQHDAFLSGDGDLFFTSFTSDPGWQTAQLLPFNQSAHRAGFTITRVETNQDMVWANAIWEEEGETFQRLLFFENRGSRYRQVPTDPNYWGELKRSETEWGEIYYYKVDEAWVIDITSFVAKYCQGTCKPITLMLTDGYAETAVPVHISIPSPRIIGLDEDGQASSLFWQQLQWRLKDRFSPATIRFAVPPPRTTPCCRNLDYENAAAEFMQQNPNIKVELVALEALPEDLSTLTTQFDGAAVAPTVDVVAAGAIYDLTNFANTDPDFFANDFYEHIWQGTQWRERMWFVPLTAEFNLLYYDKVAFANANIPEPNLFWQWSDINHYGPGLLTGQPDNSSLTWYFIDISQDTLFAHAYSLANNCPETAVPPCLQSLQSHHIATTLDWYKELVQQDHIPDLTQLSNGERDWIMDNYQSAKRHALFWVDEPILFEYYLLLDPVGVVPFPGVDSMEGITPLWVDGAFISSQSEHPYATWQWLKFLSYQQPVKGYRLVPARSSVAAETNYWRNLPRPLVDAMRTAYTFSRPVTLSEKRYFNWAQLADVVSEVRTTEEAAQQILQINWFGQK